MSKPTKASIAKRIATIAGAETTLKAQLGVLSRELLTYVVETGDIEMVTRLFNVLTPINKRRALQYFPNFLPWDFDKKTNEFGKKIKNPKTVASKVEKIKKFLDSAENDIFSWGVDNADKPKKPVNHRANVLKAVNKAIKGDENRKLSPEDWASILKEVSIEHPMFKQGLGKLVADDAE